MDALSPVHTFATSSCMMFRVDLILCSAQLKIFVDGLFHLNNDISQFKEHLRDFLIQIKVCTPFYTNGIAIIITYMKNIVLGGG